MDEELIGKVIARNVSDSVGRKIAEWLGYNCQCVMGPPLGGSVRSGRYPWKDDDNEIREVFNMDSNRLNRFVSMINSAGGNFCIEDAIGTRPMVHIDIPCDMLSHLHIDGDGSVGPQAFNGVCIPAICDIQTFNDRAVQITFSDGSQTKCVCGKDETFNLYEGIAFCLFKRVLGKEDGHKLFNGLMRYAMKTLNEQEKRQSIMLEAIEKERRRVEKIKKQRAKRKAKKREEQIGVFVEALRKNREIMMEEDWGSMVKPDEPNPYIAPGEPEPPVKSDEKATDDGTLFFDPLSDRSFISSHHKVSMAVTTINKRLVEYGWETVNGWYQELGLETIGGLGDTIGWNLDHMLEISFTGDITEDGKACEIIVYLTKPVEIKEG